jgi:hypothetical protein
MEDGLDVPGLMPATKSSGFFQTERLFGTCATVMEFGPKRGKRKKDVEFYRLNE